MENGLEAELDEDLGYSKYVPPSPKKRTENRIKKLNKMQR